MSDWNIDYIDELALWSAPFGLKLLEAIDYKPNLSVLDIGFGTGFPLTEIAMRLGDSCTVLLLSALSMDITKENRISNNSVLYIISSFNLFGSEKS